MGICGNQSKLNVVLFAILIFILTTWLICFVWVTFFADVPYEETEPEVLGGYFEGDMILPHGVEGRNVMRDEKFRWPKAKVLYKFDSKFPDAAQKVVLESMREIEGLSCVTFAPADRDATSYVTIYNTTSGCYSTVGYIQGASMNLESRCWYKPPILHELLHILGFMHQQSAPNRDEHIKIIEENVAPGKMGNFAKLSPTEFTDFGLPYDYESIMHYGAYYFSKNGKKTMVPIPDPNVQIGQRRELSKYDKMKLNIMYHCDSPKT